MRPVDLTPIDEALIDSVRDRILCEFEPDAIYLFGSAARSEATDGSDIDLLVVMDVPADTDQFELAGRIRRLFDGWMVPFDIIVQSPAEFHRAKESPGHISRAAAHGRLLYRG